MDFFFTFAAGCILGLIFGDKSNITDTAWEKFAVVCVISLAVFLFLPPGVYLLFADQRPAGTHIDFTFPNLALNFAPYTITIWLGFILCFRYAVLIKKGKRDKAAKKAANNDLIDDFGDL